MNYTLNQLRIFLKIVENKSITKASEELFLTQPAASIQLKKFQDQFSVPLTEVIGRQLHITNFGEEIAQVAERILAEVEAIQYKALAFEGKLAGKLTFSVVSTGKYVMPYFLSSFTKMHPNIDFSMDVTNKSKVVQSLEANEVDFALVSVIPEQLALNKVPLMENKLFLVGSSELEQERTVKVNEVLDKYPLLFREEGSATRMAMENFLAKKGIIVTKRLELTSNEALKQALIAGLGYSVMPLIGLKNELKNNDLKLLKMRGLPVKTTWNLVWLKSKKLSPVAEAYLNYIEAQKQEIIQKHFSWTAHL